MSRLDPLKLHVSRQRGFGPYGCGQNRWNTLTHSDLNRDLFLETRLAYAAEAVSGWYSRLMRDEALTEWTWGGEVLAELHEYCHHGRGFQLGTAA